ncbi:MAG: sigma 54-interacting transcriptional regulator [Acidobacteria bacterium]|nr:sigma 54-interacting transcriptional regulator [Acidobacteriota bacterium]
MTTLGELRAAVSRGEIRRRSVKDEVRENLAAKLRTGQPLFPGIIGYDDTVVPQIINAILARHNFILLGLRGQAKSRILRALTSLLDEYVPVVPGSEINDDPLAPLSAYARARVETEGDAMPIGWLGREARYVEKLATPDVTIADMIGDIDPIRAARSGSSLSSELNMHFGLLPRANRGVFAINELPDLAGKIQVGLFNILQEGDVQIKGYPVRLPLDVMVVFTANPEDYTARGKIITPLKDRIGAEIRTHYMANRADAQAITAQEAWTDRAGGGIEVPLFVREVVEEIAFQARNDRRVDKRSGVSQRMPISALETAISNAERRALVAGESPVVPRITDVYAALPSMIGKFELEYEGELKGAEHIGRELVRAAVARIFEGYVSDADVRPVVEWFDNGGSLNLSDLESAANVLEQAGRVRGLIDLAHRSGGMAPDAAAPRVAAAVDFVLEGLYSQKHISRSDERGFHGSEPARKSIPTPSRTPVLTPDDDDDDPKGGSSRGRKKRYYN